jgi:hypothetical protein
MQALSEKAADEDTAQHDPPEKVFQIRFIKSLHCD